MTVEKTASALTPNDVAKLANKLNDNMVHAVMHAYKGGINCDIPTATQKALAKRGLATWDSYQGADLTALGLQVQEYLKAKAEAAEQAKMETLAEKLAAERKIRDEGYEAGRKLAQRQNEDQIKGLWNTVQILISRYPGCETVITAKEMEERSDLGVVSTIDEVDGGKRLKVRQR